MKKKIILGFLLGFFLAIVVTSQAAQDLTALIRSFQEQIQTLTKQLEALMAQESPKEFTKTMRLGSRHPEVKRLQEFLKTWPDIYPEGIVSGYFGSLTEAAVKRFQAKYGIETVGLVGPKTRQKLNELVKEKAAAIQPSPIQETPKPAEPQATTTPPTLTVQPATTTPATPSTAPSTSAVLPTPGQLGMPLISFFGWGQNDIRIQFIHDPGTYTRSYAVYLKNPAQTAATKFGPYTIPAIGKTATSSDGTSFSRLGPESFEWKNSFNFVANVDGVYEAFIKAVGDGEVEGLSSPGRISTLLSPIIFENLLQDSPLRDVVNSVVSRFPLTIRLTNPNRDLYYRYELYDGTTLVWDTGYLKQSTTPKIEAVFNNVNQYQFTSAKTYRIRADSFDNSNGQQSEIKQKTAEITFTYSP